MTIFNATSGEIVFEKTRFARSAGERAKGLMFAKRGQVDYALIFELPRAGRFEAAIHMLFVFFPIDALFLDEQKKIVDLCLNLAPFSLGHVPRQASQFIIEWRAGLGGQVRLGDTLDWDPDPFLPGKKPA